MNIVLTGMRGSGKSTIGRILSKKLNKSIIDSDKEIEKTIGMKISDAVAKYGWDYFREKEQEQISLISKTINNTIISTGGGVVLNKKNTDLLKHNGIIVFINTPVHVLQDRIKNFSNRPSITGINPKEELGKVWEERKKLYIDSADIVYNKNDLEITPLDAENIIKLIDNK